MNVVIPSHLYRIYTQILTKPTQKLNKLMHASQ